MSLIKSLWILLVLVPWTVWVQASPIGSKNITFVNRANQEHDDDDGMPYRPYKDSASFLRYTSRTRQSRASRPVNYNPDEVVSCGSCCFDVLPLRGSTFVSEDSPHREALLKNRFYVKLIDVAGIPLVASYDVRDAALLETALILVKMASNNPFLLDHLRDEKIHFAVIGKDEKITDLPSYDSLDPSSWDYARGVGATRWRPVSSCAEEDVLCLYGATYAGENICVHEHAHTLQGSGGKLDIPRMIEFNGRQQNLDTILQEVYNDRIINIDSAGKVYFLWENTYASTNHEEMWAEGVQSYYNVNREGPSSGDGIHNNVWSRSLLEAYHIELHDVIEAVFPSDVNLGCPGTSMDNCDCNQIQQLCQKVGVVSTPTVQLTRPPTRNPSELPTELPTELTTSFPPVPPPNPIVSTPTVQLTRPPTRNPSELPTESTTSFPTVPPPTPIVSTPTVQLTRPPTRNPSELPTELPTSFPTVPPPTPKPSPPSRQWPSSNPTEAPSADRIPGMVLEASGGRRNGRICEYSIKAAALVFSFLMMS